jgi:hypothetical protein
MPRWAEHVVHMGKMRNVCKILVIKPEGKKPHGGIDIDGRI